LIDELGPTVQPGELLVSDYEVVRLLDKGPKHEIYDAWSRHRQCRCIAKTMGSGPPWDDHDRRRLLREGRLLARMTHPHIVRAYETIREPRPVIVLETLTGETLKHAINRLDRLRVADVALMGQQLCSAIAYLHEHGWLHLDLKPSNLVREGGIVKVLDLSVMRRPGRARGGLGTDGYMAPEQIVGGKLSSATDVWGIGIVMFEAATGLLPSEDPDAEEHDTSMDDSTGGSYSDAPLEPIVEPLPSLGARRRAPRALTEIVDRCLALDPRERPSVEELRRALQQVTGIDLKHAGAAEL
jgi:eukaryotic-like serine/threonine-protein kinase